jgi:hypothetical protein
MPETQLDLLQPCSTFVREFGKRASEVMGREPRHADLLTTTLDYFEDGTGRHARASNAPASIYGTQDQSFRNASGREPVVNSAFCPTGHRHTANSLAFADQVDDHPARLAQLDMFDGEFRGFAPTETAAQKYCQQCQVALTLDCGRIWCGE